MHVSQLKLPHPASQLGSSFSSEQNAGHESDIIKPLPLSEASPSVSGLSYLNSEWSDKAPVEKGLAKGTLASPEYALAAKRRAQKYASLHAPQDGPQDTPHGPFNNPSPSPSVARPASQSGDALVKQTALTRVVADSPPPASVGRWERRDNIHRRWLASNTARKAAPASTFAESQPATASGNARAELPSMPTSEVPSKTPSTAPPLRTSHVRDSKLSDTESQIIIGSDDASVLLSCARAFGLHSEIMEPALGSTVHSQPDGQKILAVDKEDTTRRKTEGVSNCLHAIGNGGARLISDVYTSSIRGLRPALALVLTTRNAQILVAFILGVPFRDAYRSLALSLSRELTDANDILLVSYYPAPLPPWKWTESRMPARCAANRAWCGAVQYALDWQESLDERCGDDFVREGCDDLHRRLRHGDLAAWFLCFVLPLALLLLLLLLLRRALHAFFAFLLRKNRPCAACTCTCGRKDKIAASYTSPQTA